MASPIPMHQVVKGWSPLSLFPALSLHRLLFHTSRPEGVVAGRPELGQAVASVEKAAGARPADTTAMDTTPPSDTVSGDGDRGGGGDAAYH
jgi:hypothetical protein